MRVAVVCALVVLCGCSSPNDLDIDVDAFEPIPELNALDFSRIGGTALEYWELRFGMSNGPEILRDSVMGSGGRLSRAELPQATRAALDAASSRSGFAPGCLPGYCYLYAVAVQDGQVVVHATVAGLRQIIGDIDTAEEAALLVRAHGYYWEPNGTNTGQRQVSEGWELVVLELVRDCAPVQTDRVLLRVSPEGTLREIDREVWQKDDNSCI